MLTLSLSLKKNAFVYLWISFYYFHIYIHINFFPLQCLTAKPRMTAFISLSVSTFLHSPVLARRCQSYNSNWFFGPLLSSLKTSQLKIPGQRPLKSHKISNNRHTNLCTRISFWYLNTSCLFGIYIYVIGSQFLFIDLF